MKSFVQLGESDAIQGLITWIPSELSKLLPNTQWDLRFSWMNAVLYQSKVKEKSNNVKKRN